MDNNDAPTLSNEQTHSGDHAAIRPTLEKGLAGRYEILSEIGHGGMAIVFRARDLRHDRTVALKVLRPELAVALGAERFQREIQIEARLNHPNVLALFDSGQCGHLLYFVAPWAEDGSLKDLLKRETRLSFEDARRITCEVGEALAHAHANGIVHRDVKPDNILFRSGHALLADFGIAHAVAEGGQAAITQTGFVVGTPLYMSPEQGSGSAEIDARSDQYALACILFEMLTGDPPFTGRSAQAILARHQIDHPPSLGAIRPDVPATIVVAVERALQKRPQDRFANVDEFIAAIGGYGSGSQGVVVTRSSRRGWWIAGGVAVAALVAAFVLTRDRARPLSTSKVAVFPLGIRGMVPGDSGIGVGIAYLCEAALERAEPLRFIDVASELTPDARQHPEDMAGDVARRIARQASAEWYVRGVIQGHQDSVTLILRLFSVSGDSLVRQVSQTSATDSAPLHHLGVDAIKQLLPLLIDPTRSVDLGPLRDRSAPAIALWMQGERRYRESRFAEARDFYARALEQDSSFALAALKGAMAANWLHDQIQETALLSKAIARESLLTPRYASFAHALDFQLHGSADSAVTRLLALEKSAPGWAEPSVALGETYYHQFVAPSRDATKMAEAAFRRAYDADSGFTPPLFHLAEIALRDGRKNDGTQLLEKFRRTAPDEALLGQLVLMRACLVDGVPIAWGITSGVNPKGSFDAAKALSAGALQNRCSEAGFRAVLRSVGSSDGERWGAFLGLQGLLIARGSTRDARALIDSTVKAGKGAARTLYVLASLAGADMSDAVRELDTYARTTYGDDYAKVRANEGLWALSCWHLAAGDKERVRILAALLDARAHASNDPRDQLFAASANAHLLLSQGDTTAAIAKLGALQNAGDVAWGFGSTAAPDRLLLARLLLSSGRPRESLVAAAAFDHAEPIVFVQYVAASLEVRYRAARALGDDRAAQDARRRLERLDRQDLIK